MKNFYIYAFSIILVFSVQGCFAVDNPDAIDYLSGLEKKEKDYLNNIDNVDGYRETLVAYTEYHEFLMNEINSLTNELESKLPKSRRPLLAASHEQWLLFKEKEFVLIDDTWTRDFSGSSSPMVRGKYKAKVLRARVLELAGYLRSF